MLFLRDEQVWAVPLAGGEAEQITALPHGVSAFEHAPRGRRLALAAAAPEPRFLVGRRRAARPRRSRASSRASTGGSTARAILDRHTHLCVQEARAGARPRRLTRGDWSVEGFSLVAGREAHRVLRRARRADGRPRAGAGRARRAGGAAASRASSRGWRARAARSAGRPDGEHVAFLGINEAGEPFGCEDSLWVVPSGGGDPRDLAPVRHLVMHLHLTQACDLLDWEADSGSGLAWDGSGAVICPRTMAGHSSLWRFPLEGEPEQVEGCEPHVHGYAHGGGRIVTFRAVDGRRARALRRAARRAAARRLTRDGAAWQRPLEGISYEDVSIPGPMAPIRATLVSPRGAGRKPLPLVLSIIGGPGSSWGPEPWLPDRALAVAGARVLMPDPRGSASYGRAWLEAIRGDWGGADAEDQLACVDWAVRQGLADPERLGVTGLSYGGFMTHWLIGQSDRFRAAVAANGVANQISAAANCDLGALWTPRLGWERPPADFERLWRQSPLAHAEAHHDAPADAPGRGRSPLPGGRQRAALRGAARARAHRRVRALPGGVAPDAGDRPAGPPDRHARADASAGSATTACSTRRSRDPARRDPAGQNR